jgi:hypothetical protein
MNGFFIIARMPIRPPAGHGPPMVIRLPPFLMPAWRAIDAGGGFAVDFASPAPKASVSSHAA